MSTLNLQHFIATQNALAVREERVPTYMYLGHQGKEVSEELDTWATRVENYLNGIRLFGQENGRKEDGYGERTYHFIDLENMVNILRSVGLSKSFKELMKDFPTEQGWTWLETKTKVTPKEETGDHDRHTREITLEDVSLDVLCDGIESGKYMGIDCVDYNGIVHRQCKLIKISDLHPDTTVTTKQLNEAETAYVDVEVTKPGVRSDLYLIITPECMEKGWITREEKDEDGKPIVTLQASPMLRSPLGFVTMRISRLGDVKTRFPNGTGLLSSLCPDHVSYDYYDSVMAKTTLVIQNTNVPGVIYQSISHLARQAFLTKEHQEAFETVVDTILSPEDEGDGIAKLYKNWMLLTGQHYQYRTLLEEALRISKMVPKMIDGGARIGVDQQFMLTRVVDVNFNYRWAILEEFEAILNPQGYLSGKSSITSANPTPYYIKTLNFETKEWEVEPCTKYILTHAGVTKYFARGEVPEDLINVNELEDPIIKSLPDIYNVIKQQQAAMVDSLKKE